MAIDYFVQNPDVEAAYKANPYGLTPELFANIHFINSGESEGRSAPASLPTTVEDLYRQYAGREPDPSGKAFWEAGFGNTIDTNEIASFINAVAEARAQGTEPAAITTSGVKPVDTSATDVQGDIGFTSNNIGAAIPATGLLGASAVAAPLSQEEIVTKIKNQILAQGTTDKWSGAGYGSVEANAADMAKIIAATGVTDISQFGKVTTYAPVEEVGKTYNGQPVRTYSNEDGTSRTVFLKEESDGEGGTYYAQVDIPKDAKLETVYGLYTDGGGEYGGSYSQIDPSKISVRDGKIVAAVGETFGNKLTETPVANTYSERQTGNAFGGTFAGKGNTGYRVEFAPNGTPVFYTTGASSSDAADWMPMVQLALAATGAGGLLGNALLGAGASQVAAGALGNAILGGATTGIAGGDAFKGALLGGAGGALGGYLQGGTLDGLGITERQFAIADATQLAEQGLSVSQIRDSLLAGGYNDAIIDRALNALTPTATATLSNPAIDSNTVSITGTANPSLNNLIGTLSQVPTIDVTAPRPQQVSPDVLSAVTSILGGGANPPPTVEVTAERPVNRDIPVITLTPKVVDPNAPTVKTPTTPPTTDVTKKDGSLTPSDVIRILGIGTTIAGINAATGGGGASGTTQYPIVDVPADWTSPVRGVAPATTLPPINFGDRNLLIGTQWEKFLDPNYGQVPEPIQYSRPSSLSYNDLMGILGSKQGMPSASSLSINDIISGIQNQYGQARTGAMG